MTKLLALLAVTAALAAATPALAAETTSMETEHSIKEDTDGNVKESYKKTTKDAAGTKDVTKVNGKVSVDKNGGVKKTLTTENSTDPKGLMNKKTTKTKETVSNKNGKTKHTVKKVVNGETVEDTTVETDTNVAK